MDIHVITDIRRSTMTERQTAYTALLMRHRDMLWRMCWNRAGGDRDRCQDLLQEVSLALWENFDKLRPNSAAGQERAWVRWQARSVFYQMGRRKTPDMSPLSDALSDTLAADDDRRRSEMIDDLLAALGPDDQRMVRLYLEGYRGDEIGTAMGVSRDTVYQRMRRLTQKLKNVALLLLALLLTTLVAVAVVPQWRESLFGDGQADDEPVDTLPASAPPVVVPPVPADTAMAPAEVAKAVREKLEVPERLPALDPLDADEDIQRYVPSVGSRKAHVMVADNRWLIITGAEGEQVRVYDRRGRLVASQVADTLCIIDLNQWSGFAYQTFTLKIGSQTVQAVTL